MKILKTPLIVFLIVHLVQYVCIGQHDIDIITDRVLSELAEINLSISTKIEKRGKHYSARWIPRKGLSEISIDLPQGVYAGKSTTIEF